MAVGQQPIDFPPIDASMVVTVEGLPRPQGSMKHVGNGIIVYTNQKELKKWRALLHEAFFSAWGGRPALDEPVRVEAHFSLDPPKQETVAERGELHRHLGPDLDKMFRAVGDALTDAGVLKDDSRIAEISASRTKSTVTGVPQGVTVAVYRIRP